MMATKDKKYQPRNPNKAKPFAFLKPEDTWFTLVDWWVLRRSKAQVSAVKGPLLGCQPHLYHTPATDLTGIKDQKHPISLIAVLLELPLWALRMPQFWLEEGRFGCSSRTKLTLLKSA